MSDQAAEPRAETDPLPRHTDPRGLFVTALRGLYQSIVPLIAVSYGTGALLWGALLIVPIFAAVIGVSVGLAWIKWRHFTYVTGAEDIRVEQGIFSRNARSVPYERIQDVSLEQKLLPRLLGLAEVRFETGAGGKDEVTLAYLSLEEGERLRELVRERKDGAAAALAPDEEIRAEPRSDTVFAMGLRRVTTFGLFEFSLVIFAVLLGAASQLDFLFPFPVWDWKEWYRLLEGRAHLSELGRIGAALALVTAVAGIVALGVLTGIVVTVAREYGFRLDRTAKGFRRRRGLFNKTDVILPVHRVQAAVVGTRFIRRRFGWYGLEFVSLAQDGLKSSDYAAAPFARLEEIWAVLRSAGLSPPAQDAVWHRPSPKPWIDDTVLHSLFFAVLSLAGWAVSGNALALAAGVLLIGGAALVNVIGWRRHHHAVDGAQLLARSGTLAPHLTLALKVKLQSVEIAQGPLARWRGYATLHLGLAGGKLSLRGLPLEEARALRREIVEEIGAVDFSRLAR